MSPAAAASLLPPPATAAASPPVRSGGGDGAVPATGSLLLDLIEGRSPPLPAHVGGEIATASARGWGGERERESCERERDKDDVLMVLARGQGRALVDKTHSARLDFFWYLFSKKPTPIILKKG